VTPPSTSVAWRADASGRPLVVVAGDLDEAGAVQVRAAADEAAEQVGLAAGALVLDISDVFFMDSTGLGMLIGLRNSLAGRNAQLVLRGDSEWVWRVLRLTSLDGTFPRE
jgi:anti-sigma B factor antagonist